jgi:hypothetical protein
MDFGFKGNSLSSYPVQGTASPPHMAAFIQGAFGFSSSSLFALGCACQAYRFHLAFCILPRDGGLASVQVYNHNYQARKILTITYSSILDLDHGERGNNEKLERRGMLSNRYVDRIV